MQKNNKTKQVTQTVILFGLLILTIKIARGSEPYLLSSLNLIFHEAGHPIFSFLGEFMGLLGGTLGQLVVPAMFAVYFYKKYEYFSALILAWWFGENFVGISKYISDASTQYLPLIGGNHDWAVLLSSSNLILYDTVIGGVVFISGLGIMFASLILGLVVTWPNLYKYIDSQSEK